MQHSVWRDGLVAGVLGATSVALLFLAVDVITPHRGAFFTPLGLGSAVISVLGEGRPLSPVAVVLIYTVIHYAAFIAMATVAGVVVHWAKKEPSVLAGAVILFVALQIGFYAWSSIMAPVFGTLTWYQVAIGNLIAAVVMGVYLWRTHPYLRKNIDVALGARDERSPAPTRR
jgi:hypothetical protein